MSAVADASVVVAALIDGGPAGTWATDLLAREPLVVPHHLPVEVANVLRRIEASGAVSGDTVALAYADMLDLRMELASFDPFAERVWELRRNVTAYDAWYVALAEAFTLPLATLDRRLAGAPGPRCEFLVPPAG